ncbi:MAG: hypothetical protein DMF63_04145 [Acidobacteria bacterium]|nr:MAG: hypothetical protein DMF63_04145 [Acidobacteriota bacterium]
MSVLSSAPRRLRLLSLFGAFLFLAFNFSFVRAALPEDAPIVISESNSTRAVVTDPTGKRSGSPLRVIPVGARVTVYVTNLPDLLKAEGATAFRADVQDVNGYRYPLEVLSFAPTAERPWVYSLSFRLHDALGDVGDALLRVTWRGMSSNRVRISVGHEGGKIQDDEGSTPTPMPDHAIVHNQSEAVGLPWSGDRVRFMMQAGFGPTAAFELRVRRLGFSTWLEDQLEQKLDLGGIPRYSTYKYPPFAPTVTVPPVDCNGILSATDPEPDLVCFRNRYSMFPIQNWFYREALYSEDQQLRRRVSWALSQIFVVGGRETEQSGRMIEYIKILDQHAFGNFRFLLRDVTLSPAMGNYLDMARSTQQNPNENYAREILQLFSVGVDMLNQDGTPQLNEQGNRIPSYSQETVNNFTKVFTGWTFCNGPECPNRVNGVLNYIDPMAVNPANHDNSQKVLFNGTVLPAGQTPAQDLNQALDNIFYHPNVGPFISKLLIQQMVTSNPTPAYVGRVARIFNNNGSGVRGDLKAVIKAILMDPEARGNVKTDPDYGHLREPALFITNITRPFNPIANTGTPAADCLGLSDGVLNIASQPLDQDAFNPPSVFNYYPMDYIIPGTNLAGPEFGIFSTGTALKRPNLVNQIAPPNSTVVGGIPIVAPFTGQTSNPNYAPCGTRIDLSRFQNLVVADPTGATLIDALDREMLGGSMSPGMRSDIATAIQAVASSNPLKRTRTAFYLVATSPQFQVQR